MCGIVGYVGENNPREILLDGLEKLEYRGYDSAGIALLTKKETVVYKEKGRVENVRLLSSNNPESNMGIGHTRWATHGVPSFVNAHPHKSTSGRFTVVHNGVIENDKALKEMLISEGVSFLSVTDTEVIVQLIEFNVNVNKMNTEEAFVASLSSLHGSYALGLIDAENPDVLYVAKNKSPLLLAVGEDFRGIASDAMAMIKHTNQFIELKDKEYVLLTKDSHTIKEFDGTVVYRAPFTAKIDASDIDKGTYDHYMLKEIDEQPMVLRKIIQNYSNDYKEVEIDEEILKAAHDASSLHIVACGTSYHAGLVGKQLLEKIANKPVTVHIASEFVYNTPLLDSNPLFIYISQSGETADSRACLVKTNELGFKSLTITNVEGSTLSREADFTLLLYAGPEIAVASTKAYTAQISVLALLAVAMNPSYPIDILAELSKVASSIESIINHKDVFKNVVDKYLHTSRNAFFIGRGMDYYVCLEAALKLKEISYIQAEGFAGGELKHGTIALIEEGTPVIAISTNPSLDNNIRGNVQEVAARGANVCVFSSEGIFHEGDEFELDHTHELLTPLTSIITLQLLSYYAALDRGSDVDKPRNLAKSVTVE